MIAENEVVLTYLLQLMAERGILDRLAFKGGTCIRKIFIGSGGRFSTDLDITQIQEHNYEDVILDMMEAFENPFHGIQFNVPGDRYYETRGGLSWGVNPTYTHNWNPGGQSEIRLQVSRREVPTLAPSWNAQRVQSYFQYLPFAPADIRCLALPDVIAEKIRACYQRTKARDIYDLSVFATRPLDRPLIRRLVVLKLWQARDGFDPESFLARLADASAFDWEDLRQLVHRTQAIKPDEIFADCVRGLAFLAELDPAEAALATDHHQRDHAAWTMLQCDLPTSKT